MSKHPPRPHSHADGKHHHRDHDSKAGQGMIVFLVVAETDRARDQFGIFQSDDLRAVLSWTP